MDGASSYPYDPLASEFRKYDYFFEEVRGFLRPGLSSGMGWSIGELFIIAGLSLDEVWEPNVWKTQQDAGWAPRILCRNPWHSLNRQGACTCRDWPAGWGPGTPGSTRFQFYRAHRSPGTKKDWMTGSPIQEVIAYIEICLIDWQVEGSLDCQVRTTFAVKCTLGSNRWHERNVTADLVRHKDFAQELVSAARYALSTMPEASPAAATRRHGLPRPL